MLSILHNRTYRHLFFAQMVALSGTGLATVALGLLAYELAGDAAGMVLGTALTIKMIAYVTIAPIAAALAQQFNRRRVLVALDLVRAGVAVCLPFVTEVWQVYVLIFVLQSASAGFTPTFQATIPDVLTDEREYTKALSLSRLAVDMESLLSPMLAAALLTFMSFNNLFLGTCLGFLASGALVASVMLPKPTQTQKRGIYDRTTRGIRIYLKTPRLRGLLALNWVASAIVAMVFVNTVVIVRSELGLSESDVALVLAVFGAGSMIAALALPRLLEHVEDRRVMLTGASVCIATLGALSTALQFVPIQLFILMACWFAIGLGYSAIITPTGRLLVRSAHTEDRPALFAAQFTLSHGCWLIFYPLAGFLMTSGGTTLAAPILTVMAFIGLIFAMRAWPRNSSAPIVHSHDDLPADHPHLQSAGPHAHPIIIDDLHPQFLRPNHPSKV